jgi:hypothetical protein
VLLTKSRGVQIEKNEMGGGNVARMGEREMPAGFWWGNRKEGDHVGEVGIDGRIIFRE